MTDETKATLRANLESAVTEFLDHERATQASRSSIAFVAMIGYKLFARILWCIIRGSLDSCCKNISLFEGGGAESQTVTAVVCVLSFAATFERQFAFCTSVVLNKPKSSQVQAPPHTE